MGIFNYIDTFFFISLGITFILILLLVFHFKQRLANLEQKNDTMFEIINNIVKEITYIKNSTNSSPQSFYDLKPSINATIPIPFDESTTRVMEYAFTNQQEKIIVSEDDESEEDDSEEDDSEEDDSEDDDSDDDSVEQNVIGESVKIINMGDNIELKEIVAETNQSEIQENYGNIDIKQEILLQVEKIENENLDNISEFDKNVKKETNIEIYRKMTVQQLKPIVITKGLSSDPSKLKKNELLKLLEDSLEE